MERIVGATTLEIVQGDITGLAVDAIVNAANVHLQHGGGVAAAIARKGGRVIQAESDAIIAARGPLATGDAVITSGGRLPAKFVIHTAGPIWGRQGEAESDCLLCRAVCNSLARAREKKLKSIAFPAISTGSYGFPLDRAARLMLAEAVKNAAGFDRIIFCLYDERIYRVFERANE
jgi:O-acetyl-ADP-ribose deacetylase (regulator of RNase III)